MKMGGGPMQGDKKAVVVTVTHCQRNILPCFDFGSQKDCVFFKSSKNVRLFTCCTNASEIYISIRNHAQTLTDGCSIITHCIN